MKNLDVDLLRAFIAVYRYGGFSNAAKHLGRLQSSVSQQIKKLEDALGHPLFVRDRRNVNLSPEGERLLAYAEKMVNLNDEIFGRFTAHEMKGNVHIGVPEAFSAYHLPDILIGFYKAHPEIKIDVECGFSDHLIQKYEAGTLDFILFKRSPDTENKGLRVWQESMVWVGKSIEMDAQDEIPIILSPEPCVYRKKTLRFLEEHNLSWRCVYTSASITGRIAAAKSGLGIALVPKELLSISHNLFAVDSLMKLPAPRKIEIAILKEDSQLSQAANLLAEHLMFSLKSNPSLII